MTTAIHNVLQLLGGTEESPIQMESSTASFNATGVGQITKETKNA